MMNCQSDKKKMDVSKQGENHPVLSPELLVSVKQFVRERYIPGKQTETKDKYAADVGKGSDQKKISVRKERITLKDGVPVLSEDTEVYAGKSLKDMLNQKGETFQQRLFQLIDASGLADAEVYKRAHIDRKLFSKIRLNQNYRPKKRTVLALALALRLDLNETADLLRRAGLALSPSVRADLIVEYCILHGIYDINTVNALLDENGEHMLGT